MILELTPLSASHSPGLADISVPFTGLGIIYETKGAEIYRAVEKKCVFHYSHEIEYVPNVNLKHDQIVIYTLKLTDSRFDGCYLEINYMYELLTITH